MTKEELTCKHPVCRKKRWGEKNVFGPPHYPSPKCESGKRNHCTCDVCF